ncbi:MAG: roadblock/LC7 domain-containing protein, partial [Candidatus Electryoneaceae bacterium]|nr:roadblock/LC7 domain-containing protein [Candidatus Electryoneaceae bacterium]
EGLAIEGISSTVMIDTDRIGVTISLGLDISEQISQNGHLGEMRQITTEYHRGIVLITAVGDFAILVVIADVDANVGVIRHHILKSIPALENVL